MATPTFILPSAPTYTEGFVNGLNVYPNPTNFVANQVPFTRATTATRTNAAGLIELTPYNLVTWSEQFNNAAWILGAGGTASNPVVSANTIISPSGLQNAETIVFDRGAGNTLTDQSVITQSLTIATTNTHNFSIYLKATASGDVGKQIFIRCGSGGNLQAVTLTANWVRYESTASVTAGVNVVQLGNRGTITNANSVSVDVWGAQLVEGTSALPYQLTETRLNRPRVDFSLGGCPNLLLEPQRTNLVLRSEEFENAYWVKANVSVTANSAASPSGIINADKIIPNTSSANHSVVTPYNISVSGSSITASVYLKADGYNFAKLIITRDAAYTNYYRVLFNLSNGTIVSADGIIYVGNQSITSVGNGWYRCVITVTNAATNNTHGLEIGSLSTGVDVPYIGNGTSGTLSWGAQIELGAYPTTYVPTTAATVTRNSDTFTLSNVFTNNLISSAGGTWFADLRDNQVLIRDTFAAVSHFQTSAVTNSFVFFNHSSTSGGRIQISKFISGTATTLYTTTSNTSKIAIKWNGTTADIFENGVKVVSETAFTTTNMDSLTSGSGLRTTINSMALWNTPLTDDELEVITGTAFDTYALMASNYNYILQ
jgi:hypothetical protein